MLRSATDLYKESKLWSAIDTHIWLEEILCSSFAVEERGLTQICEMGRSYVWERIRKSNENKLHEDKDSHESIVEQNLGDHKLFAEVLINFSIWL
jgi:hypothetical protein